MIAWAGLERMAAAVAPDDLDVRAALALAARCQAADLARLRQAGSQGMSEQDRRRRRRGRLRHGAGGRHGAGDGRHAVTLLGATRADGADLTPTHRNDAALPGIELPEALRIRRRGGCAISDAQYRALRHAVAGAGAMRRDSMRLISAKDAVVVTCAKGIEKATGRPADRRAGRAQLPRHAIAVLSGPGFAADIARGLPTAMVVAAPESPRSPSGWRRRISGRTFRLYPSADRIGVQLGGALKNVLAIACGIVEGAGLGDSARAALIARGLAEMSRFVAAMGGSAETVTRPLRPGRSGADRPPAISRATCASASQLGRGETRRSSRANWSRAPLPPPSPRGSRANAASTCRSPMPSPRSSRASSASTPRSARLDDPADHHRIIP